MFFSAVQVQFQLNRLPLCEMHQAVDRLRLLDLVFPDVESVSCIPWTPNRYGSFSGRSVSESLCVQSCAIYP